MEQQLFSKYSEIEREPFQLEQLYSYQTRKRQTTNINKSEPQTNILNEFFVIQQNISK